VPTKLPKRGAPKDALLARLPTDAIAAVERTIEDDFRTWAFDLISNERWSRAYEKLNQSGPMRRHVVYQRSQHLLVVWELAGDYAKLLERAAVEYVRRLAALFHGWKSSFNEVERQEALVAALLFVQRFTEGEYNRPWGSSFLLPAADSREMPSERAFSVDFQRGNALSRLFSEAERRTTPETVAATFSTEIEKGEWKNRVAQKSNDELLLATVAAKQTAQTAKLTGRERAIWEVIRRGSRGRLYCRELDEAKISPPRKGLWSEAPRKYVAAYDQGHPWSHRIQDEKCKIRRKAGLAELAGE
jgi:hypothetical protein